MVACPAGKQRRAPLPSFRDALHSPQIDVAVRAALVPRLSDTLSSPSTESVPVLGASHPSSTDLSATAYQSFGLSAADTKETPLSVTTLKPSSLNKIQEFLLLGERRKAYHYALDEHLWAHAMVIASSIDKESWKDVVQDFLKTELGNKELDSVTGREGLRMAYSLFSGQGAASGKTYCIR